MNEIQVAYFFKKLCPKRFDYLDYMYIFIHKYVSMSHVNIFAVSVFLLCNCVLGKKKPKVLVYRISKSSEEKC